MSLVLRGVQVVEGGSFMQTKPYLQYLYRAVALGCMLYALTLITDTAHASALSIAATELACHLSQLDNSH